MFEYWCLGEFAVEFILFNEYEQARSMQTKAFKYPILTYTL